MAEVAIRVLELVDWALRSPSIGYRHRLTGAALQHLMEICGASERPGPTGQRWGLVRQPERRSPALPRCSARLWLRLHL